MKQPKQFGRPQHFGSQAEGVSGQVQPGDPQHCAQCEAMLADVLDDALSPADQALFDAHLTHCGPCAQMLADARRGAAWLEMLRDPRPEPPAELLEKILAQTSGLQASGLPASGAQTTGIRTSGLQATAFHSPGLLSPAQSTAAHTNNAPLYSGALARPGRILSFPGRVAYAVRSSAFSQVMLQPRLIMTAAMAFFSIALTMDLTGVRPQDLRASDLRPSSLKRSFYSANARVVQYYEGLRVVYELESRVHDLQSVSDSDESAPAQSSPANPAPSSSQPGSRPAPAQQPDQQPPAGKPAPGPHSGRPAPDPGTSRRESRESHEFTDRRTERRLA